MMDDWLKDGDPDCDHEIVSTTKVDICVKCEGWYVYP